MSTPKFSMHQKVYKILRLRGRWRISGRHKITKIMRSTHPYYYLDGFLGTAENNIFPTKKDAEKECMKRNIIMELEK